MLGVSLSQIVYGPLSEGIGRKTPIVFGSIIMLVGSFLCFHAETVDRLIWGRFVQGLGAGAAASLWHSIFRDRFSGAELSKYASYLVIFIMFLIPVAPVLGGFLEESFGWRSNFQFMIGLGVFVIVVFLLGFSETNTHKNLSRLNLSYIVKTYKRLLADPLFVGVCFSVFFSYGACFTWLTVGPVLLIKLLKISPSYFGILNAVSAVFGYGIAGFLNGRLVPKLDVIKMLRLGWGIMIFSGASLFVGYMIFGLTVWGVMIPVTFIYFGSSFIWPNAFSIAFTPFGNIAGYVGSLYGSFQIGGAFALGGLSSLLPDTLFVFATIVVGSSLIAWIFFEKCVRTRIE